jgi:hypothetical protein
MVKNKFGALLLAAALMPAVATADTVTLKADYPDRYIVQKGDTLWDISGRFLNEPWLWPQVWEANPQIENPHLIYPGDEITLRYRDGRPVVMVGRRVPKGTVRLSPQVRVLELDTAIPTIPIDIIQQFLSRPRVVTESQIDDAPYIVSVGREALIGKPGGKVYARGVGGKRGDKFSIYRKGQPYVESAAEDGKLSDPRARGFRAMFIDGDGTETPPEWRENLHDMWIENNRMRLRSRSVTPVGEILGYEAIHIGDAVLETPGDPATLIVTGSKRELLGGDRLFPVVDEEINRNFMPRAPDRNVSGEIISVVDGVSQIGQYQVVVLNLGQRDGIEIGHVMGVYQRGEVIEDLYVKPPSDETADMDKSEIELDPDKQGGLDGFFKAADDVVVDIHHGIKKRFQSRSQTIKLPDERAGTIMVFRPYERFSYALVMEATRAMHINDIVKNP